MNSIPENDSPAARFGAFVIRRRWWILLLTLLLVGMAASGARFIHFSTDYRVFFSKDNPQLNAFETLQNTYTKNDSVLIAVAPKDGRVFTRETLSALEDISLASWQTPFSTRVDSITNFQHTWADGDDLVVEDLIQNAKEYSDADLERVKRIALAEPLLVNRLITDKTNVTGVNITVYLPGKSIAEVPEVAAFSRKAVDEYRAKYPELDFYLTGIVFMNNAFSEAGQGDMKELVPLMYLLVIILVGVTLRSFSGMFGTLVVMAFSILTGMGLAGWLGIDLTPISASAPTIILTLAVADSIHILVTMFHQMRLGRSRKEALVESLRLNHQPVFITSVTTAIGFLSMNFSDSPPFRDLGNIVAMGVMAAYVYSVTFLPALMSIIPVRVKPVQGSPKVWCDGVAEFVIKNRKGLYWGMIGVFVFLALQVPRIEIDERFNEYFDHRYQFRWDNDFVTKNLTGFESIEYSLGAGESGGISNPEYLAKVKEFAEWYAKQPTVMYVRSFTDIMKRLNKNLHGDDASYYKLPDERELAAQYLLLYEMSLPFGLDLNDQINIDKSSIRFTANIEDVSTQEALELEEKAQTWFRENAPAGFGSHGASPMIMFSHIARRNVLSMITGTVLALTLISLILVVALRSFKFGLLSMIPNLVPICMTFGVWGLAFQKIGMAVSVAGPVALGIIVDDTVHFLSKYLRARREQGKSPEQAVRYSFHTVGTALAATSLILVCGFMILASSGFTTNSHMGLLTAIAVVCALAADFLFLPLALMKFEEKRWKRDSAALREVPERASQ